MREVGEGKSLLPGGGGEYFWEFLVGVCRPVLQILTRFQTKKCDFLHSFSDQTSKIVSDLAFRQKLCYHYLIRLGRKHKNYSNLFGIRIFLFLSYSFGIETVKCSYTPVAPSKTQPDSRSK